MSDPPAVVRGGRPRFTVRVTRDGHWWMVAIPELDGLTQARDRSEVEAAARELISVAFDVPPASFDVEIT